MKALKRKAVRLVYVRKADEELWGQATKLAEETRVALSTLVADGLKLVIAEKYWVKKWLKNYLKR